MVVPPDVTPVTTPADDTVAIDDVVFHVPPARASLNVVVSPTQTLGEPVIAGIVATVTTTPTAQDPVV